MFHRILVGVDDSPAACLALQRAIELAEEGHGRIGILVSAPQPASVIWAGPIAVPQSRAGMCEQLENWACKCIEAAMTSIPDDMPVTKLVTHGDPAEALLREAERGDWDLVVVGQASRRHRIPFQRPVGERLREHLRPGARGARRARAGAGSQGGPSQALVAQAGHRARGASPSAAC